MIWITASLIHQSVQSFSPEVERLCARERGLKIYQLLVDGFAAALKSAQSRSFRKSAMEFEMVEASP
jgi:hypothetical protein